MGLSDFFVRDGKPAAQKAAEAAPQAPAVEVRDPSESVDIIDALLHGKELVTKIETDFGVFEFKYPSGADNLKIAHRRAAYLGGYPDSAFDNSRRFQFEMWATLDVLIVGRPDRIKDMESWADFPDQALVEDLYDRGARFCIDIRQRVRGPRPGKPDGKGEPANP